MVASVGGKDVEILSSLSGQANWAAMNSNATLSATGIWRGESVAVDVASPKPLVLFAGGAAPLTLSFKAAPATFSFDGTASMSENAYFDGQAKFAAPSLRRVLEWSQAGIAPGAAIGSVSISSKITATAGRVKFDNTAMALDNNPGMGALDFSLGEAQPVISGTLAFDTLDLRSFLSAFTPLAPAGGAGPGEIDTSFADRINLDLRLSAAHATAGAIQLADVAATAQVKDGLSVFDISDASAFGGNIQTSLRFDRKPEGTQVEIRLLASDIDGGAFGTAAGMTRLVPVGTGTVSVILKGPGRTWDSIFENADGSVSATFGPGALSKLNLPAFLKHTEQGGFFALDDVADGTLPIDGAEIKASISKGVAQDRQGRSQFGEIQDLAVRHRAPMRGAGWRCPAASSSRTRRRRRRTASRAPTSRRSSSAEPGARRSFRRSAAAFRASKRSRAPFRRTNPSPALRGLLVELALHLAPLVGDRSDDDADRDDGDQDGAGGVDLRRHAEADLAVDLHRQRRGAGPGGEAGDDQIVERQREGQHPAGDDRRHDDRQRDLEEGLHRRRAEIHRRLLQRAVEGDQPRLHDDGHEAHGEA